MILIYAILAGSPRHPKSGEWINIEITEWTYHIPVKSPWHSCNPRKHRQRICHWSPSFGGIFNHVPPFWGVISTNIAICSPMALKAPLVWCFNPPNNHRASHCPGMGYPSPASAVALPPRRPRPRDGSSQGPPRRSLLFLSHGMGPAVGEKRSGCTMYVWCYIYIYIYIFL